MTHNLVVRIGSVLKSTNAILHWSICGLKITWNFLGREIYFGVTNESFSNDILRVMGS